ncbi:MAG: TRAP transporter small permease [Alphaproteobacteria bacterium]
MKPRAAEAGGAAGRGCAALIRLTDSASCLVLASMAVVVCVDVVCRYALGFSTQIAEEAASLGLVALIFLSLPGAFRDGALLRVDAVYSHLASGLKNLLDVLFHLIALAVTLVYIVQLGRLAAGSFAQGIRSDMALGTPNYLPQAVMVLGLVVLLGAIVAGFLRTLRHLRNSPSAVEGAAQAKDALAK